MSECLSPARNVGEIQDAKEFLKGLRSISLRNLTIRAPPAVAGNTGVVGKLSANGERDLAVVTSGSLPSLRAKVLLNDSASPGDGPSLHTAAGAESPLIHNNSALLTTTIAHGTVNPTWPIPETAWLHTHNTTHVAEQLESVRTLLLRVHAAGSHADLGRDAPVPGNDSNSSSSSPGNSLESCGENTRAFGLEGQSTSEMVGQAGELEPLLWECVIDVRGLTALPPRTKLSQLWALPADCLLLEMSNEALYAPDWVVEALESNSAIPRASRGGSGVGAADAWRDGSDEDEDENQQPIDEVLRQVLDMEGAAERGRAELSRILQNHSEQRRAEFERDKQVELMAKLELQLKAEESLLQAEEACLEKEKRQLQNEAAAVEKLLNDLAATEEAAAADAVQLEFDKRETMKSHVLLEARRARLTAELQAIYPIKFQEKSGEYSIRGLELPMDLYSIDDERVSSALGYTVHLVCMLAKYLQVPLRYQLIYNASRSAVRDNVSGAGVAYPLFRRGVEKERFDRGVYLLGRDVEQMLTTRGIPLKRGVGQLLRNLERLMTVESA